MPYTREMGVTPRRRPYCDRARRIYSFVTAAHASILASSTRTAISEKIKRHRQHEARATTLPKPTRTMTTMEFTLGMSIPFSMIDVASKTSPLPSVNCRTTSSRFFTFKNKMSAYVRLTYVQYSKYYFIFLPWNRGASTVRQLRKEHERCSRQYFVKHSTPSAGQQTAKR